MFPKSFVHRAVHRFFISEETPHSSPLLSLFLLLPLFFLPNSAERNIRIPIRILSTIEKSMFRIGVFAGRRQKKERKEKNKLKGKDFTGASGVFETCSYTIRIQHTRPNRGFIYSSRNSFVTRQTCKNTKIGIAFRNLVRRGY